MFIIALEGNIGTGKSTLGKLIQDRIQFIDGVEFILYDLTGKTLIQRSNSTQIDLTKFSTGIYLLEIWHDGKFYRNKIIKE